MAGLPAASAPTCYCQPFGVSMLTLKGCELKLILKGIS